jgi:hypothetical protein
MEMKFLLLWFSGDIDMLVTWNPPMVDDGLNGKLVNACKLGRPMPRKRIAYADHMASLKMHGLCLLNSASWARDVRLSLLRPLAS